MPENPYRPSVVRVERVTVENDARDLLTFDLRFADAAARAAFEFLPGQFAFLSIPGVGEAPFGIASAPHEEFVRFTVKRVGVFTTALHELAPGDLLGLRGPYGNSYPFEEMRGRNLLIVSGGFSFTTLRAVIAHILVPENRNDYGRVVVVYGARTPGELLYKEELRAWEKRAELDLFLCADRTGGLDWPKIEGLVPNVLKEIGARGAVPVENCVALVCGPPVMLFYTQPVLKELGFGEERVYLSLENRMKCGIGKCGRCNIGAQYVCKDGPVFSLAALARLPKEY